MPVPIIAGGLLAMLWSWLASILPALISKILLAIGIGFVTYQGIDVMFSSIEAAIITILGGVSADIIKIFGLARVDEMLSIVLSAHAIRIALVTVGGGIKRMQIK